jgi:hypothetical protein
MIHSESLAVWAGIRPGHRSYHFMQSVVGYVMRIITPGEYLAAVQIGGSPGSLVQPILNTRFDILVVFEMVHFAMKTDKMVEKKEHMKRRICLQVMLDISTYLT